MVNCPKCKTKNTTPKKSWIMASSKKGAPEIHVGIFECQECGAKFRAKVESKSKVSTAENVNPPDFASLIGKLNEIKLGLNNNLSKLRENLQVIESQRSGINLRFEELDAESRADDLEDEVNDLKDELRSLKDLLGYKDDEEDSTQPSG